MPGTVPHALIDAPTLTRRLYALNTTPGLSDSGLQILLLLAHVDGELRAKQIQDELVLEQSRVSHLLAALTAAGFVSWTVSPTHSRHRSYRLAEDGSAIVMRFVPRALRELGLSRSGL